MGASYAKNDDRKAFVAALQESRVRDILDARARKSTSLRTLQADASVGQGLSLLQDHRLLYAPVMEQAQFVGYFAVVDVAQVLCDRAHYAKLMPELERLHERQQDEGSNRSPEGQALPPRRDDWSIPSGFFGTTIGAFLFLIKEGKLRNRIVRLSVDASLLDLLKLLYRERVCRLAVVATDGRLLDVVTQGDLVGYLASAIQASFLQEHASKTMQQLGLCGSQGAPRNIHAVQVTDSAVAAVALIHRQRISSVAVVDGERRFVTVFGLSDLRGLDDKQISSLQLPVREFLSRNASQPPSPVQSFLAQDTILEAIRLMAASRLHRLYILDSPGAGRPIGVVSMSDIVSWLGSALQLEGPANEATVLREPPPPGGNTNPAEKGPLKGAGWRVVSRK